MTRYIYEILLTPEEDKSAWNVTVPDLEGCLTFGDSIDDAVNQAADALMTYIASMLKNGDALASPVFGHKAPSEEMVIALAVEVDADYIVDGVSPSVAATMLGVSRGRVSQMIRDGVLITYEHAGERVVDLASINARLAAPRAAGRPRKEASPKLAVA